MSEPIRRKYMSVRLPCWVCSRPLEKATRGVNAGLYVGAVRILLGIERLTHICCTGETINREPPRQLSERSGRRIARSPRLDELDEYAR